MEDFETHPRGTFDEIKASRALASAIEEELQSHNCELPVKVIQAYNRLYGQYIRQMEMEQQ
jgi:hypothetical protein